MSVNSEGIELTPRQRQPEGRGANSYAAIAQRWFWFPLALAIIAAAAAYLYTTGAPVVYQATSTVLVTSTQAGAPSPLSAEEVAVIDARLMTSRDLLQHVISELNLKQTPNQLQGSVAVAATPGTSFITVEVSSSDPSESTGIANTLVNDFIADSTAKQQAANQAEMARLQAQIATLEARIATQGKRIAVLEAETRRTADESAELAVLTQKQTADTDVYTSLLRNYDLTSSDQEPFQLTIVDSATAPASPVGSSRIQKVALAAIVGFVAALAIIYLFTTPVGAFIRSPLRVRR